jgi:lysophospholipase L1-like esterase
MGTNEAFSPAFKKEDFLVQIDSLVSSIKKINPHSSILFTTPGDAMRRVKYKNPRNKIAGKTIIDYATEKNYAYWNLFEIMGGYGSIQKWYAKKLTAKDKLHLNRRGYELQGELFAKALIKAYLHQKKQ